MTRLRHKLINDLEVEACRVEAIMENDGKSEMDFLDSMNYTYKRPEDYVVLGILHSSYKFGLMVALYYLLLDPFKKLKPEQTLEWLRAPEVSIISDDTQLKLLVEFIYKGYLECVKLVINVLLKKDLPRWHLPFALRRMAATQNQWKVFHFLTDWIKEHSDALNEIYNEMDANKY